MLLIGSLLLIGVTAWKFLVERRVYASATRDHGSWRIARRALNRHVARGASVVAIALVPVWILRFYLQVRDFRDPFVPLGEDVNFLLRETIFGPVWFAQGVAILALVAVLAHIGWKRPRQGDPFELATVPSPKPASLNSASPAGVASEAVRASAGVDASMASGDQSAVHLEEGAPSARVVSPDYRVMDEPLPRVVSPSDASSSGVFWVPTNGESDALWWVVALAALGLAVTLSYSSHALSVDENRALAVAADLLHTLAAGSWIGSLTWVLFTIRMRDVERDGLWGAQLQAFSPLAVVAVTTLVSMGLYLGWEYLISVSDLWTTTYGRILLAKVGVAGVVLLAGFINWRRGMPSIDSPIARGALARRASWEVGVAIVVLILTGFLTGAPRPYVPSSVSMTDQAPLSQPDR
jgi:putative copper export protein